MSSEMCEISFLHDLQTYRMLREGSETLIGYLFYIGCSVGTLGLDGHSMLITFHNSVVELHLAS